MSQPFLFFNISPITAQYDPFRRAIWLRLYCKMAEIEMQDISY